MKQEETTSWLYFRMLYCTGAQLIDPISSFCCYANYQVQIREVLVNTVVLGTGFGSYAKYWVGKSKGTTVIF